MEETLNNNIKEQILRRTYSMWFARRLFGSFLPKLAVTVAAATSLAHFVFVDMVLHNLPHSLSQMFTYLLSAFVGTEIVVQLSILAGSAFVVMMFVDLVRISDTYLGKRVILQ